MEACAIRGWKRSAPARGRSTLCSRRAEPERGGEVMHHLFITTAVAVVGASAAIAQPRPAEANVRAALERIARIDAQLHSVIAVDPTAIDQPRRVDAGSLRGPPARQPVLIKVNIESAASLAT